MFALRRLAIVSLVFVTCATRASGQATLTVLSNKLYQGSGSTNFGIDGAYFEVVFSQTVSARVLMISQPER